MAQREIRFRGKRITTGDWIFGYYYYDIKEKTHHIITDYFQPGFEVSPESVSQYTGLKDKKGEDIYEKDCYRDTIEYDEQDEYLYFICAYVKSQSAFCWVINVDYKFGFHELDTLPEDIEDYSTVCNYDLHKIQIIGNIYDKPELLNN